MKVKFKKGKVIGGEHLPIYSTFIGLKFYLFRIIAQF